MKILQGIFVSAYIIGYVGNALLVDIKCLNRV